MKKETVLIQDTETAVKVQNSRIAAVRKKDIAKKAVRVYDKDLIGIGGAVGDIGWNTLEKSAVEDLESGIPYPHGIEGGLRDHRDYRRKSFTDEGLQMAMEKILGTLNEKFPALRFSEGLKQKETLHRMENTDGLDLEYRDAHTELFLLVKEKEGANLFDNMIVYYGRDFDVDGFLDHADRFLTAHLEKASLPEGKKVPVFFLMNDSLLGFLNRALNGEAYATGSSLLSGKLDAKIFNERITIEQNRDPEIAFTPFFDTEGVVKPCDKVELVKDGKLMNVFTDKQTASEYDLAHTGAASGGHDDVPSLSGAPLRFVPDAKNIANSLKGEPAILVSVTSGGEFTADGNYGAPVQCAYLFDGKRLLGRLPEFSIKSSLFDMLGKDYIGTFETDILPYTDKPLLQGFRMEIIR